MDYISQRLLMASSSAPQNYWIAAWGMGLEDEDDLPFSIRGGDIAVDKDGNVYILATKTSTEEDRSFLIAKLDTDGIMQWQRVLNDEGFAIAVDQNGNVYLTGFTFVEELIGGVPYYREDMTVSKLDTNGTVQWHVVLGDNYLQLGYGIDVDQAGNVYVIGLTSTSLDFIIAKLDTDGVLQWQRSLNSSTSDAGEGDIAVDQDGNVYITGTLGGALITVKYDTNGTIQWQRILEPYSNSIRTFGTSIAVDQASNVYVGGLFYIQNTEGSYSLTLKYDTDGVLQWHRTLEGYWRDFTGETIMSRSAYSYAIAVDQAGNAYLFGNILESPIGTNTPLIVKYDTYGTLQWQHTMDLSSGFLIANPCIAIDQNRNVYVAGIGGTNNGFFELNPPGAGAAALITKLPGNGSLTGTYSWIFNDYEPTVQWTYQESSYLPSTYLLSSSPSSLTSSISSLTSSPSSLTSSPFSLTSTTIIPLN
jgi:hypothetical protein